MSPAPFKRKKARHRLPIKIRGAVHCEYAHPHCSTVNCICGMHAPISANPATLSLLGLDVYGAPRGCCICAV